MGNRGSRASGLLLLAYCGVAAGADPVFNYLEVAHEDGHADVEDGSPFAVESLSIGASWEVINHLALRVEFASITQGAQEFTALRAGADAHWSLFHAAAAYNFVTDEMEKLGVGLRVRPADPIEIDALVGAVSLPRHRDGSAAGLGFEVGVRLHVTSRVAFGVDYTRVAVTDDPGSLTRLSFRYHPGGGR